MTDEQAINTLTEQQRKAYDDRNFTLVYAIETAIKAIQEKKRLQEYIEAKERV